MPLMEGMRFLSENHSHKHEEREEGINGLQAPKTKPCRHAVDHVRPQGLD